MKELRFTKKTFAYFEGARRHGEDREWFEAHRSQYVEYVELPFTELILQLRERLSPMIPGIAFSPRRLSKPLRRQIQDKDVPLIRENAMASFAETATSRFESNPGLYLSVGAKPEDNVYGCGLYMPSGRQIRELRPRFGSDGEALKKILSARAFKKHWAGLTGERYKRFPKEFDENAAGAEYLWHKQFFLGRTVTRDDALDPEFFPRTVEAMAAAVPFLAWTRQAVGLYRKPKIFHED